ncbi:uncharacterized protein LOC123560635 [Mercenaria mercenaria]|uniref:uncharacterized protein LOC123560635 n=1 Tax=Mercenaria mercenaria TaxID=6596 RepID=UPI00234EDBC4|nr:uncharacterized protein LOC123560635 [Mercenaria mercenaria]
MAGISLHRKPELSRCLFKEGQGSDEAAKEAIQLYAALLANEMDLYYCSVDMADPSLSIKIYLAGVEIPEVGSDVSWSADSQDVSDGVTYINIDKVLPKLQSWLASESGLPQHDHLMALSTIELADFNYKPVETGVAGYAYVGTVCSSTGKVSISEVDGSRVALIASHELGHGLNANHDSGDCPNGAKNIMTTSFSSTTKVGYAEAQWTFSTCSVAAFKSFIDSLDSNCLKQHAFSGSEFAELQAKSLPGTVYSLDQQCQMYNGIWSSSCDTTLSESDCYDGFHCSTSSDLPAGCLTGFYPLYPFAGTPCGAPEDNKWCYRGRCVQKSTEATTTTSTTTSSTTSTTTSSTTSSTLSTTICTTSSTSTTPSTSTSTTSSTSPTTSTTPSTTSSTTTSPTTTSTTPSTTTTSTTPSTTTTSTIPSTTTTSTTPSTTTTSTTPSTTTTSTTPSTTTSSTTPSTTTTSTTPSTTSTTTPTPCNKKKKCCVKVGKKKKCCKGTTCCKKSFTWAVETECYKSCCISTGTTAAPTPTPCYKKKCCTKQNKKKVCCKKADCCKKSWGKDTKCCLTCK